RDWSSDVCSSDLYWVAPPPSSLEIPLETYLVPFMIFPRFGICIQYTPGTGPCQPPRCCRAPHLELGYGARGGSSTYTVQNLETGGISLNSFEFTPAQ